MSRSPVRPSYKAFRVVGLGRVYPTRAISRAYRHHDVIRLIMPCDGVRTAPRVVLRASAVFSWVAQCAKPNPHTDSNRAQGALKRSNGWTYGCPCFSLCFESHTHPHTHVYIFIYIYIYIHIHPLYIYIYAYMCIYIYIYVCMCVFVIYV